MANENAAWREYAADFDGMTDEEIESEFQASLHLLAEQESWTEAVIAWRAAGCPRLGDTA